MIAANPALRERELVKMATLAGVLAEVMRDGVAQLRAVAAAG